MKNTSQRKNEGYVLIAVLATVLILGGVAVGLSKASSDNGNFAANGILRIKAQLAAEGAVDTAIGKALANPTQLEFEGDLAQAGKEGQQITAHFGFSRVPASRFSATMKSLSQQSPDTQVIWVRAKGQANRGAKSTARHNVNAIILPVGDRGKVLVWAADNK